MVIEQNLKVTPLRWENRDRVFWLAGLKRTGSYRVVQVCRHKPFPSISRLQSQETAHYTMAVPIKAGGRELGF